MFYLIYFILLLDTTNQTSIDLQTTEPIYSTQEQCLDYATQLEEAYTLYMEESETSGIVVTRCKRIEGYRGL